jgi:hypothetical protein
MSLTPPPPAPAPRRVVLRALAAMLGLLTVALLAHAFIRGHEADWDSSSKPPSPSKRPDARSARVALVAARTDGPRSSSFRACPNKVTGDCDYGEACDYTKYDLPPCLSGDCSPPEQTGDLRCHRICADGLCADGETCVKRRLFVSDYGVPEVPLCLCSGSSCPTRGPEAEPWPAEGGLALWRAEQSMPVDLYSHASAASQDRVFVSGGLSFQRGSTSSLDQRATVFSAPIQADGALGAWTESAQLPDPLVHHTMVVADQRLFVAGGELQGGFSKEVSSAALRKDGTLGPWQAEASLPQPRGWHALVAAGAELWVVGGSLDKSYFTTGTSQLWRAKRSASRIEGWESIEAPSELHFDQTPAVAMGRLYVTGAKGTLYSMSLDAEHAWRTEPSTPSWSGRSHGAAQRPDVVRLLAMEDRLVLLMQQGHVLTAPLQAEGRVGPWSQASRMYGPGSRFTASQGVDGRIYVFGGTSATPEERRNARVWSSQPTAVR